MTTGTETALESGTVIESRYALERLLGEGGMGAVWSARHVVTGKRVALKFLKVANAELGRRLVREARVAAALRHPNLVEVHDVLELPDGRPLLVMDLLEGEPLSALLERRGALDPASVGALLLPVISAVATAHAGGVVHRDLKPDNIFLLSEGAGDRVKVLDFGIAKLTRDFASLRHTAAELTQTGSVLGTPTYMAPEQVFGERDIDHRADVWSLGIILYECLAGRCPTEGDNVGQIFKTISLRSFPSLEQACPTVGRDLGLLVDRMLSSRPHQRPSLVEVATVLAAHAGLPAPALPATPATTEGASASGPAIGAEETLAAAPPPRSALRRTFVVGGLVAASAVIVGVAWAYGAVRPGAVEPPTSPLASTVASSVPRAPQPTIPAAATTEPTRSPPDDVDVARVAQVASGPRAPIAAPAASAAPAARSVPSPTPSSTTLPGGVHAGSPY